MDYCNALLNEHLQTSIKTVASYTEHSGTDCNPNITLQSHDPLLSRNNGHIRRYLTSDATKWLVNGLITHPLDYSKAFFKGLPHTCIERLQRIHKTAVRIVTRIRNQYWRSCIGYLLRSECNWKSLFAHMMRYLNILPYINMIYWQLMNEEKHPNQ